MKKKILSISFLFSLLAIVSCSNNEELKNSTATKDKSTPQVVEDDEGGPDSGNVTTVWSIGRKSRNCFSIGICKLTKVKVKLETIEATIYNNRMFAGNVKAIDDSSFILQVNDENMLDIVKEFGGNYITLEEDFTIEPEEAVNLNLAEGFTIKAGTYNFVKNNSNSLYEV